MSFITFDTETTGLRPGSICQLAYIVDDGGTIAGANYFFKVGYIEPGAQKVHGYSLELLDRLSGGYPFERRMEPIYDDFASCSTWIAHNFSFDFSFLQTEFKRCGKNLDAGTRQFCTMRHFAPIMKLPPIRVKAGAMHYKYPNLTELAVYVGLTENEITGFACEAFNVEKADIRYHDARYDSSTAYLCYKKGVIGGCGPDRANL